MCSKNVSVCTGQPYKYWWFPHVLFLFFFFQNKSMHLTKRTYYKTNKSLLYIWMTYVREISHQYQFPPSAQCCPRSLRRGKSEDCRGGRGRRMASQVGVYVMLLVTMLLDNNGRRVIGGGHGRRHVNHPVTNIHLECTFWPTTDPQSASTP